MSIFTDLGAGAAGGILGGIGTLVKDVRQAITGEMTSEQQLVLQQKLMDLELAVANGQMEMIKAEASSSDPWTSRARPSFMYIFYFILLTMGIFVPALAIWFPIQSTQFYANVKLGFAAIPDSLYTLFGAGYLGYAGCRSFEKIKGATK